MARGKAHIPGFGRWEVDEDDAISKYFEIARKSKGGMEVNGGGHGDYAPKGGAGIRKRTNKVDNAIHRKNEQKLKRVQRRGGGEISELPMWYQTSNHQTGRQAGILPGSPPTISPLTSRASGSTREYNRGRVPFPKVPIGGSPSPKKQVYRAIPVSSRGMLSAPLATKEHNLHRKRVETGQEIYQKRPWIKQEMHPKRPGNRSDMCFSPQARKEMGRSRTPIASPVRPNGGNASSDKKYKNKSVPKFGDWDLNDPTAGILFTTLFNDARNERKGTVPASSSPPRETGTPIDEDLYKQPNIHQKKYVEKLLSRFSKMFSAKGICQ